MKREEGIHKENNDFYEKLRARVKVSADEWEKEHPLRGHKTK